MKSANPMLSEIDEKEGRYLHRVMESSPINTELGHMHKKKIYIYIKGNYFLKSGNNI